MMPKVKRKSVLLQSSFPLILNDLVPKNHSARLIGAVVEQLEIPIKITPEFPKSHKK
jgi:hypothetical protein